MNTQRYAYSNTYRNDHNMNTQRYEQNNTNEAIKAVLSHMRTRNNILVVANIGLNENEFQFVRWLVEVLAPYASFTTTLSGSQYITASYVYPFDHDLIVNHLPSIKPLSTNSPFFKLSKQIIDSLLAS